MHTVGALPFHKDRAGSVISLKARHHRIYAALAAYWEVKRGHLFQKHAMVNWDVKRCG